MSAALAQVVSIPITVLIDRPAPDIRPATILMDGPAHAHRIPTALFRCDGDLNGDKQTNSEDLNIVLGGFGCIADPPPPLAPPTFCPGDVNFDAATNSLDLNLVLASFGQPCR